MLTTKRQLQRLRAQVRNFRDAAVKARFHLSGVRNTVTAPGDRANAVKLPDVRDDDIWRRIEVGDIWGMAEQTGIYRQQDTSVWGLPADGGTTQWLHVRVEIPHAWRGRPIQLHMKWEGVKQLGPEVTAYWDGATIGGLDEYHRWLWLPCSHENYEGDLLLRAFIPQSQRFNGIELLLIEDCWDELAWLFEVTLDVIDYCDQNAPTRYHLIRYLEAAYNQLVLWQGWQDESAVVSARSAVASLKEAVKCEQVRHKEPRITCVGHCHIDTAWLWPRWRGDQKIERTVAIALDLMDRYPEYVFCMSQPYAFRALQKNDPVLYERVKVRVAEGRFEPIGAMWVEPELNIPDGESLVRHLMYGAACYDEEFGLHSPVAWLPDMFGAPGQLPQLLKQAGIDIVITSKLSWNEYNRQPNDTFRWRGIDGSEVLVHCLTTSGEPVSHAMDVQVYTYNASINVGTVMGTWAHYRNKDFCEDVLMPFGPGDGGGGPADADLRVAATLASLPGVPAVRLGRVQEFVSALKAAVYANPAMPVWSGELYLETHRGVYTSQLGLKRVNQQTEIAFRLAEWLHAWAVAKGAKAERAELDEGWMTFLTSHAHDVIAGTCGPAAAEEAVHDHMRAQTLALQVHTRALTTILANVTHEVPIDPCDRSSSGHSNVHVFNALSWFRTGVVQVKKASFDHDAQLSVMGSRAWQVVRTHDGSEELLAQVTVPPCGYARLSPLQQESEVDAKATTRSLENAYLLVELNECGEVSGIYDKEASRQVVAPGSSCNQLWLYEDRPTPPVRSTFPFPYDSWEIEANYDTKGMPLRRTTSIEVVETGPIRACIKTTRSFGYSNLDQYVCVTRGSRRVDFVTVIDWHEESVLLRALFPLLINCRTVNYGIQYGAIDRASHCNTTWEAAQFEVPAHNWADASEGGYGVALLTELHHGFSARHSMIGLSLIRGTTHPMPSADHGVQTFTYSMYPHMGDWRSARVPHYAYELKYPLSPVVAAELAYDAVIEEAVTSLVPGDSVLQVINQNVIVDAIKLSNDGRGIIVRLFEAYNIRGQVVVQLGFGAKRAVEVDVRERPLGELGLENGVIAFHMRPYEIKTIMLEL